MKSIRFLWSLATVFLLIQTGLAQNTPVTAPSSKDSVAFQEAAFKVYGNCGMCKSRIEAALKSVTGVAGARWDASAKMVTLQYEEKVVSLKDLHSKLAAVGHDTDEARAPDEVYNKLPGCCKYDRPKAQ